MPRLSLAKIFLCIVGVIALAHLKNILECIGLVYEWFAESLGFIRDFPEGAQAAIAMLTIIWIVTIVCKAIGK